MQGKIEGFGLPGNSRIRYLEWFTRNIAKKHKHGIRILLLEVDLYHFWWRQDFVKEEFGFYDIDISASAHKAEVQIFAPNELEVVGEGETSMLPSMKEKYFRGGEICKESGIRVSEPGRHDFRNLGSYIDTVTKDKHRIILQYDLSTEMKPNQRCFILLQSKGN